MLSLEFYLKKYFNFSDFRPGQREIIESILSGKDVVALMPTGGGKSLCFQLPALINDGVSIVISPLIALMKDQVDRLQARGISATFLNSSLSLDEEHERERGIKRAKFKLVYVAPERLKSNYFKEFLNSLKISMIAVDEAHCVSEWGHDFRPDYARIKEHLSHLSSRPPIAAFTATATQEVCDDIVRRLALKNPNVFVRGFDRPNLKFFVHEILSTKESWLEALRIVKATPGATIMYTITRKNAEEITEFLQRNHVAARSYHAGMNAFDRVRVQNDFMENKFKVIVATIAFGMGVDKPDIRLVLHVGMPSSLEGYYQEAGRAGRDGQGAYCVLLPTKRDVGLHCHFIKKNSFEMKQQGKESNEINRVSAIKFDRLEKIKLYVQMRTCRRKMILDYFADPTKDQYDENCGACDVCLDFTWSKRNLVAEKIIKKKYSSADNFVGKKALTEAGALSRTVAETVELLQRKYEPEQIAKIRNLGVSTIIGHLISWYISGGDLPFEKFVTIQEEQEILSALRNAREDSYLKSIKEQLRENISYEKIRLVIAKNQKIQL
jgi:ATP-dependent DNA helicase RecQ